MFDGIKREWAELKRGKPGKRFKSQFDRNKKEASTPFGRVMRIMLGILLFPVGVFFLAVPGPGLVVIAIGAIILARESRMAASAMDAIEVRVRQAINAIRGKRRAAKT